MLETTNRTVEGTYSGLVKQIMGNSAYRNADGEWATLVPGEFLAADGM